MTEFVDTAEDIYKIIESHPGIHFRQILEESGRQLGVVEYHLQRLEKGERIISVHHRNLKLFFDFTWRLRIGSVMILIANLRKTVPRQILLLLSQSPEMHNLSIKELAKVLEMSPSALHWHIKRLTEDELIKPCRRGREVTLELLFDKELISKLGREIYPNRWERFLDSIEAKFN